MIRVNGEYTQKYCGCPYKEKGEACCDGDKELTSDGQLVLSPSCCKKPIVLWEGERVCGCPSPYTEKDGACCNGDIELTSDGEQKVSPPCCEKPIVSWEGGKFCGCPDGTEDKGNGLCCKDGQTWFSSNRFLDYPLCGCSPDGYKSSDGGACCKDGKELNIETGVYDVNSSKCCSQEEGYEWIENSENSEGLCCSTNATFESDQECYCAKNPNDAKCSDSCSDDQEKVSNGECCAKGDIATSDDGTKTCCDDYNSKVCCEHYGQTWENDSCCVTVDSSESEMQSFSDSQSCCDPENIFKDSDGGLSCCLKELVTDIVSGVKTCCDAYSVAISGVCCEIGKVVTLTLTGIQKCCSVLEEAIAGKACCSPDDKECICEADPNDERCKGECEGDECCEGISKPGSRCDYTCQGSDGSYSWVKTNSACCENDSECIGYNYNNGLLQLCGICNADKKMCESVYPHENQNCCEGFGKKFCPASGDSSSSCIKPTECCPADKPTDKSDCYSCDNGQWTFVAGLNDNYAECGCPNDGKWNEDKKVCCKDGYRLSYGEYSVVSAEACGCPDGGESPNGTCCKDGFKSYWTDMKEVDYEVCGVCPAGSQPMYDGSEVQCCKGDSIWTSWDQNWSNNAFGADACLCIGKANEVQYASDSSVYWPNRSCTYCITEGDEKNENEYIEYHVAYYDEYDRTRYGLSELESDVLSSGSSMWGEKPGPVNSDEGKVAYQKCCDAIGGKINENGYCVEKNNT
jgi:hypothetical protein